jgi:6-hydroxycyclohex-1-ene-1-carbonyl-CoA dehydrogenase
MPQSITGYGLNLTACGQPLEESPLEELRPGPDEVLVEVAGCGVCHTDLGFWAGHVPTRHPLPLILGHEIAGQVVLCGENATAWAEQAVLVPAVIPCGTCAACAAGRPTICRHQFMPGNDGHGGFASHVRVPARGLCSIPQPLPKGIELAHLSVVADAITTPYEAIRRAGLSADDVAVFVGVGGVGGFGVQIAAAFGAAVVAVDVDERRLQAAARHGAALTLDATSLDPKELKKEVRGFAKSCGRGGIGLKVFETSGTPAGQQTAFNLLDFGGYLAVVGFTPKTVEIRLSNLMALDATARGNWGCPPQWYPEALELVLSGKIELSSSIETHPLKDATKVLEDLAHHRLTKRPILLP